MTLDIPPIDPPPRLLMGPGPVNVDPRVLRAMAMPMLGQFDPVFTRYMNEAMELYRRLYRTRNRWTFLIDGTARAGIEAILVSLLSPGERVLVPIFGRFGHLLCEVAERCGAELVRIETEWGTVFDPAAIEEAVLKHHPRVLAMVHGDTSTTMAQPLEEGLEARFARHRLASAATAAGLGALQLELFGDQRHKMANVTGVVIPAGIDGEAARAMMLQDFGIEIGTSFGPLKGRIWRIGTMGYVCRKENVLRCLAALEATLRYQGFRAPAGAAVDAALGVYRAAEGAGS